MAKTSAPALPETGHLVEQAMAAAGVSINRLADLTGIPFSTLRRKLRALSDFTLGEIVAIAEVLGVSPADLLPSAFGLAVSA